jgi:hypothetical protein
MFQELGDLRRVIMCLCYTIWYTSTPNISYCREVSAHPNAGAKNPPIWLKSAILRHMTTFPVPVP